MLRTWIIPIWLGLMTGVGLISALLGDGIWDALSWLALAVPVALCIYYWARSTKRPSRKGLVNRRDAEDRLRDERRLRR